MGFEISEETRQKTTNCPSNFLCLTEEENQRCFEDIAMCPVGTMTVGVLFVKCPSLLNCPYALSFGDSYICQCPTRLEIYKKYNK